MSLISSKIRQGTSSQDALRYYIGKKDIVYEGLKNDKYKTLNDLAEAYGVSYRTLTNKYRRGISTKEALTDMLNMPYEGLHGDRYRHKSDLARAYGINYTNFRYAINNGMEIREAIKYLLSIKDKNYRDAFGNSYSSIRQMVNKWNIGFGTLHNRLSIGIEICVALVAKDKVQLKFVGLDGKARYKLGNCEDPLTARQIVEYYRPDLLEAYDKYNPTGKYEPYRLNKLNKEDTTDE